MCQGDKVGFSVDAFENITVIDREPIEWFGGVILVSLHTLVVVLEGEGESE